MQSEPVAGSPGEAGSLTPVMGIRVWNLMDLV